MPDQNTDESIQLYNFVLPLITTLFIGGLISGIYYVIDFLKDRLTAKFLATIKLENSEPLFEWVNQFLVEKGYITQVMNNLSVKTERSSSTPGWYVNNDITGDSEKPTIIFLPAIGYHSFNFKGVKITMFHETGQTIQTGQEKKPTKLETLTLSCLWPWNLKTLKQLCEEAMDFALNKDQGKTSIYALKNMWMFEWEKVQSKKPRPFHSVILDSNVAEEIVNDIRNFKQNQAWYVQRGVPYRRGYLLYGPPGTGKTSFVLAVAAELNLSICTLNLSGSELDDEGLNRSLQNTPRNAIILLEDVDAIFVERTSVSESHDRKVSFSGLLNALDGVRSQEGRILFMSTNHLEKLDQALLRPGRSDLLVKLDYATQDQIRRMFLRFFPDAKKELVERFVEQVPENKLSMAKLQGHFLRSSFRSSFFEFY